MGFIDMSDADYLPVFYNVYHAVGIRSATRTITHALEQDEKFNDHSAAGRTVNQSIGRDGNERYVPQSLGRDGGGGYVNQSIGRDSRERSVIQSIGGGSERLVTQSIGKGDANRTVSQSIGRDGGESTINTTTVDVWASCPNHPDDVKLVQYLLKAFYDVQPPPVRPQGEMKIDGLCGAVTNRWIWQFQRDCNRASGEPVLLADNRVDKVLNRNLVGGISRKMYTLALLNINVKHYSPEVWAKTPLFVPLHNPHGVQISYKGIVAANDAA